MCSLDTIFSAADTLLLTSYILCPVFKIFFVFNGLGVREGGNGFIESQNPLRDGIGNLDQEKNEFEF